jgi:hypothetical protein
MTRTDWKPSANYRLAAEVRRINAQLGRLSPDRQSELQREWLASWDALMCERENATNDDEKFQAVEAWCAHWERRLNPHPPSSPEKI